MKQLSDGEGNVLYFDDKGKVFLKLQAKPRRYIGWLKKQDSSFHTLRKEMHVFSALNGFGLNWQLMHSGKVKYVIVSFDGNRYYASIKTVLESEVMNFKAKGYELQHFVPLEKFHKIPQQVEMDNGYTAQNSDTEPQDNSGESREADGG